MMTGKLTQHIAVTHILLKKKILGWDLKPERLFICNLQKLNHFFKKRWFCAELKPRGMLFFILTSTIEISIET